MSKILDLHPRYWDYALYKLKSCPYCKGPVAKKIISLFGTESYTCKCCGREYLWDGRLILMEEY